MIKLNGILYSSLQTYTKEGYHDKGKIVLLRQSFENRRWNRVKLSLGCRWRSWLGDFFWEK